MNEMEQLLFEKKNTGIEMSFILFIPKNINNNSTLILNGITPNIGTEEQREIDQEKGTNLYGTYLEIALAYSPAISSLTSVYLATSIFLFNILFTLSCTAFISKLTFNILNTPYMIMLISSSTTNIYID